MGQGAGTPAAASAETEILTFVSAAAGLSAFAWSITFNYGAFGVIFLGHTIAVWLFSMSVVTVTLLARHPMLPGGARLGYGVLALPSVWLVLRVVDDATRKGQLTDYLLHAAGGLAILLSLPYLTYLFLRFTNPGVVRLRRRYLAGLLTLGLFIGGLGWFLGSHNYLLMTCEEFVVSGQDTPDNCAKSK
jgi:hypothetical protein